VFELEALVAYAGFNVSMFLVLFASAKLRSSKATMWTKRIGLITSATFLIGISTTSVYGAVVGEYWHSTGPARPWEVACDVSANRAFYTAQMSNRIGLVEWGAGKFTEWTIPTQGSNPWGIALGPEIYTDTGTFVWFTESVGSKIGRLSPITGEFVEWRTTTPAAEPRDIAVDRTRLTVWFTEFMVNQIGKLTYVGQVGWQMTEYLLPPAIRGPHHLTVDSDGIVWFTALGSYHVARFNPWKGEFTGYSVPSSPNGITFDQDGFAWFTSIGTNMICRLNWWRNETVGWVVPTGGSSPSQIVVDQDRNVWFTEFATSKIGKLVPGTANFHEYPTPTPGGQPYGICIHSSDTIVFTEAQANRLGRVFQPAWMAGGVDTKTTTVDWISRACPTTTTATMISSTTTVSPASPRMTTAFTTSTVAAWSIRSSTITETKSILDSMTITSTQKSTASGRTVTIHEYRLAGTPIPWGITTDKDGVAWITEQGTNKIAKVGLTTSEYNIPTPGSVPWGITSSRHYEDIWFTEENAGKIAQFVPSENKFYEWELPGPRDARPRGMTMNLTKMSNGKAPRCDLWFTEYSRNRIGRLYGPDPTQLRFSFYTIPGVSDAQPMCIAMSPVDYSIWFTEYKTNRISSIKLLENGTALFRHYQTGPISSFDSGLWGIGVDPDGFVWVAESKRNCIGRLNPVSREYVTFAIPTGYSEPRELALEATTTPPYTVLNVWFTEYNGDKIGRYDPGLNVFFEYPIISTGGKPYGIAISAAYGAVWFTEPFAQIVGELYGWSTAPAITSTTALASTVAVTVSYTTGASATLTTIRTTPTTTAAAVSLSITSVMLSISLVIGILVIFLTIRYSKKGKAPALKGARLAKEEKEPTKGEVLKTIEPEAKKKLEDYERYLKRLEELKAQGRISGKVYDRLLRKYKREEEDT